MTMPSAGDAGEVSLLRAHCPKCGQTGLDLRMAAGQSVIICLAACGWAITFVEAFAALALATKRNAALEKLIRRFDSFRESLLEKEYDRHSPSLTTLLDDTRAALLKTAEEGGAKCERELTAEGGGFCQLQRDHRGLCEAQP